MKLLTTTALVAATALATSAFAESHSSLPNVKWSRTAGQFNDHAMELRHTEE